VVFTGWRRHSLLFGSEFRLNLRQDQGDLFAGEAVPIFRRRGDSSNWAIYAQDEFAITKAVILYLGTRYDYYSQFGGTTNPRLGLVYRPWTNTALKFTYGAAFRAPNAWELHYTGSQNRPNPTLRPEKISTYETSAEHTFHNAVRFTGTFFQNRISQLIDQVEEPAGIFMFRNVGKVSANGVEAEVEGKWNNDLRTRLSYTFVQTRDEIAHSSLTHSPKHLVKLNFTAPLVSHRLFAALEGQYTSGSRGLADRVGGVALFNVSAFAPKLARNLDMSFSLYNLFDRKYAYLGGEEQAAPVPQDGRTFRLKLTYRF